MKVKIISIAVFITLVLYSSVFAKELPVVPDAHTYLIGGETGWPELKVSLRRIDFLTVFPSGEIPNEGVVVVVLGDITATQNKKSCLYKHNYKLNIGSQSFKSPSTTLSWSVRDVYAGLDDPTAAFVGACAEPNKPNTIFMWFDVKNTDGPVSLNFDNDKRIVIADSFQELLLKSGEKVFAPTSTPMPTNTSTSTPKTTPTITGTRPTFTPTSSPTSTPVPTNTPLPTPTLKPLDALKNAIATLENTCSGGCKFSEVEFDTDGDSEGKMIVRFIDKAPGSIWSNDDFNRDTGLKIFYTLKAINELDVDYDAIAFEFGVPVIDKYGNESAELGISCLFTKETVKRINYSNIRMRYIVDLADRAYINPVLKQN